MNSAPVFAMEKFLAKYYDIVVNGMDDPAPTRAIDEAVGLQRRKRVSKKEFFPLVALFEEHRNGIELILEHFADGHHWADCIGLIRIFVGDDTIAKGKTIVDNMGTSAQLFGREAVPADTGVPNQIAPEDDAAGKTAEDPFLGELVVLPTTVDRAHNTKIEARKRKDFMGINHIDARGGENPYVSISSTSMPLVRVAGTIPKVIAWMEKNKIPVPDAMRVMERQWNDNGGK